MKIVLKFAILSCLVLLAGCERATVSEEDMRMSVSEKLSYQHIMQRSETGRSHISVHQVKFYGCVLSYSIVENRQGINARYTVRIGLGGISGVTIDEDKSGYPSLVLKTGGQSIVKEYPDGELIHEKTQYIPLKEVDQQTIMYLKKIIKSCKTKN